MQIAAGWLLAGLLAGCAPAPDALPPPAPLKPPAPGDTVFFIPVREKRVALTFDDGPNEPATGQILDHLKRLNVKATFFLVGENVACYPETAKRIAAEGHAVGCHTERHLHFDQVTESEVVADITNGARTIRTLAGVAPQWFRPPFGINGPGMETACRDAGMAIAGWSLDANDWNVHPVEEMVNHLDGFATAGDIILLHDGRETQHGVERQATVETVPLIVDQLRQQGFTFVTLPELVRQAGPPLAEFANGVKLLGVEAPAQPFHSVEDVPVRYIWDVPADWSDRSPMAFVHLHPVPDGFQFQDDHAIAPRGDVRDRIVRHRLAIPADAPPGRYVFHVGLFDPVNPDVKNRIKVGSDYPQEQRKVRLPVAIEVQAGTPAR